MVDVKTASTSFFVRALHGCGVDGDSAGPAWTDTEPGGSMVSGTELHKETAGLGRALHDGLGMP